MPEEIKCCPFCGNKPSMLSADFGKPFKVYCYDCEIGQFKGFNKEEYAIDEWNRRV